MISDEVIRLLKQRLTAEVVLGLIAHPLSRPKLDGSELRDVCPVHDGADGAENFAINLKTGEWFCHSKGCRGGDLISLYQQAKGVNFPMAVQELSSYVGISPSQPYQLVNAPFSKQMVGKREKTRDLGQSRRIAEERWALVVPGTQFPYFERKGVEAPPGVRYNAMHHSVVVPLKDVEGRLQSVQYIPENGPKKFAQGTSPVGAFFALGDLSSSNCVYLAEGVATSVSIWEAENRAVPTVSCGSCNNIPPVVSALKRKYPSLKITVCLDIGQAAQEAAKKVKQLGLSGISYCRPNFEGAKGDGDTSDFNDLHQMVGLATVHKQLQIEYFIKPKEDKQVKQRGLDIKFINEISSDYFKIKPKEKPVLLQYTAKDALKVPFLHKEITGMLVAEGGRGKTHLCALLAECVVSGVPFLGQFEVTNSGAVCLILGENNLDDIHRLLWKTREHIAMWLQGNECAQVHAKLPIFHDALERIERFLCPVSVHGMAASLVDDQGNSTSFLAELLKQLKEKEPVEGWQLIIFDPASRFAGIASEKDNAVATAFIACLERISEELRGKPTILLVHHKSKAGTKEVNSQTDARGASALTDGVRWQANLSKKDDMLSLFELTKTNFTSFKKFLVRKNYRGVPEFEKWEE